jgi:nucleoside-diphosphate-sugar epimerase
MSKVEPSLSDPEMVRFCLDVNVGGTENVMRAALAASKERSNEGDAPARVVYAASSTHYGNQPVPFTESKPELLTSPYAHSKRSGEAVAFLYDALHGVPATSLRLFMVYGERQPKEGAYAVVTGTFLRRLENGEPVTIEGDGSHFRDFVHVSDVARAFVLAAQTDAARGAAINVGTGRSVSVRQVADIVSPQSQTNAPARANDLKGTLADTCLAKRVLGFEAKRDFRREMRAAVEAAKRKTKPREGGAK